MSRLIDLTGQRFGLLVALRLQWQPTKRGRVARWECRCDCGAVFSPRADVLRRPNGTRSCGCISRIATSERTSTHRMSKTRVYKTWIAMKTRCYVADSKSFKRYGGRGITVCDRWRESFENFYADMGDRPMGTTLDRYPDKSGNYEPGNCRWATAKEQANNLTSNRLITFADVTASVTEWAREAGLNPHTLSQRLDNGWSFTRAIATPTQTKVKIEGLPNV